MAKLRTNGIRLVSKTKPKETLRRKRSSMELCGTHIIKYNHKIKTVLTFIVWC